MCPFTFHPKIRAPIPIGRTGYIQQTDHVVLPLFRRLFDLYRDCLIICKRREKSRVTVEVEEDSMLMVQISSNIK